MKKTGASQKIYLLSFFLGIMLPLPLWFLVGRFVSPAAVERRQLAERPVLTGENYEEFPRQYEDYFNDHAPFRDALIICHSVTDMLLFHGSSEKVIAGEKGWYYYSAVADGDPIGDYSGKNLYTRSHMEEIAERLVAARDRLAEDGIDFVLFLAPNKTRVYPEYLPGSYGQPAEKYRLKQLIDYLRENTDLKVVYCLDAMLEAKESVKENICYMTDTHWNALGAYAGSRELCSALGAELPPINDPSYTITDSGSYSGDLARLVHLEKFIHEREYTLSGFENTAVAVDEDKIEYVSDKGKDLRVYLYRDSYADAMIEYVGSAFSATRFAYFDSYSYEDMKAFKPDVFVYEGVERYQNRLDRFSVE